jgi:hypothetical protein
MDEEQHQRITLENGMVYFQRYILIVLSRNWTYSQKAKDLVFKTHIQSCKGFPLIDLFLRKRKRYRLVRNPDYQLLHYVSMSSDPSTVQVNPSMIKVRPRPPNSLPQHPIPGIGMVRPPNAGPRPVLHPQIPKNAPKVKDIAKY